MKQHILFTDEELDDMIHGREIEIYMGHGETFYFMSEGHFMKSIRGVDMRGITEDSI